jgi:hypothetical protein
MESKCKGESKNKQLQTAQKECSLCLRVESIKTTYLKMCNLNASGLKCIVLEVGVFLLILVYSMFPLMVEYAFPFRHICLQEYRNSDLLGYSRVC